MFDTIYDGTLYGHWEAIVTMQQLIVLATPDGIVDMTPQAIAARTSIPFEIIEKGLKILADPDPYTRTPGDEGRRIILIDEHRPWGWFLVNHGKYRRLRDMKQKQEDDRVRISEKRKKIKNVAIVSQNVANVAHSDSDSDSDSTTKTRVVARASRLPRNWKLPPEWEQWAMTEKGWDSEKAQSVADAFKDYWIAVPGAPGLKLEWGATWRNWIRKERDQRSGEPAQPRRKKDPRCVAIINGERCTVGVTFWDVHGTHGKCAQHGP